MKLSDLRPCDHCGGAIAPFFYIVNVQIVGIDQSAVHATMGLVQHFSSGNKPNGA